MGLPVLIALLLWPSPARAADPSEPLFCSDPVAAICDDADRHKTDYSGILAKIKTTAQTQGQDAVFSMIGEIEKQSFIPSFQESKERLLAGVDLVPGLPADTRSSLKETISAVRFASLSSAPQAARRLEELRKKLPPNSVLGSTTPEALDTIRNLRLDRMSATERELLQTLLQILALSMAQNNSCGERVALNAFSFGEKWGMPSVALCMDSTLKLQPLGVQERYPILGAVLAHELGHQIDSRKRPGLYTRYLSCLSDSGGAEAVGTQQRAYEAVADFWSAVAMGNMLKTRAALLEEPADAQQERALRFVRAALQWTCDAPDSKTHPAWAFRLGQIFGQDPEIRRMIGCKPKPSCGIAGRSQ